MKIYVMSRIRENEILKPKVSRDFKKLSAEMDTEYHKVLYDAGHLGRGLGFLENGDLVAYYGTCRHVWRIDEYDC